MVSLIVEVAPEGGQTKETPLEQRESARRPKRSCAWNSDRRGSVRHV